MTDVRADREAMSAAFQAITEGRDHYINALNALAEKAAAEKNAETVAWMLLGLKGLINEIDNIDILMHLEQTQVFLEEEQQKIDAERARQRELEDPQWPFWPLKDNS